jgi:hypothetical protein
MDQNEEGGRVSLVLLLTFASPSLVLNWMDGMAVAAPMDAGVLHLSLFLSIVSLTATFSSLDQAGCRL